jgi:klotho protein
VFGYTAWSLLDGFEWQDAYTTRRGLFYVDFNSKQKERQPKTSAHYYKQIIQENGFILKESTPDIQGQFPCDFSWGITESVLKVSGCFQINHKLGERLCNVLLISFTQ